MGGWKVHVRFQRKALKVPCRRSRALRGPPLPFDCNRLRSAADGDVEDDGDVYREFAFLVRGNVPRGNGDGGRGCVTKSHFLSVPVEDGLPSLGHRLQAILRI